MKKKNVIEYFKKHEERVPANFRTRPELRKKAQEAADLMDVFIYEIWETALQKSLDELQPILQKKRIKIKN